MVMDTAIQATLSLTTLANSVIMIMMAVATIQLEQILTSSLTMQRNALTLTLTDTVIISMETILIISHQTPANGMIPMVMAMETTLWVTTLMSVRMSMEIRLSQA